jgi:hypothetical protein
VHGQVARGFVRQLDQNLALGDVGVVGEVGLVADRPDGDLGRLEEGERVRLDALRDEAGDDRLDLVTVREAIGVGANARVVVQLGPADRAERALGHPLRAARKRHVSAIAGAADVARRLDQAAAAQAWRGPDGQPVLGRLGAEHGEDRLAQGQIDHLAKTRGRPRPRATP